MQGLHRVTTKDKEEAIKTGKIYLDNKFYKIINGFQIKKHKKCKNCGVVLRFEKTDKNNEVNYCLECSPSNGYAGLYKVSKKLSTNE